jgi:hypothetical protein
MAGLEVKGLKIKKKSKTVLGSPQFHTVGFTKVTTKE